MKEVLSYCNEVLEGKRNTGNLEKLAVNRFLNDIKKSDYILDEKAGERACTFFTFINHTKGDRFAGKPFILEPWERFIIFNLFGWKDTNGNNRFIEAYIEVAKKNGKSCLGAGIGLIKFVAEKEPRAEVYSAATTRDQAKIVWEEARAMVEKSKVLNKHIETSQQSIYHTQSGSLFKPVSSEANNFEGKNPNCVILDEFHAHKTSRVFDNTKSAMASRTNPLLAIITTAGFNRESPCYRYRQQAAKVLEGSLKDERQFIMIFAPDDKDDWENPASWEKANPNLGISVNPEFLEAEFLAAKNNPDKLVPFLTKHLNQWTDAADIWIEDKTWLKNKIDKIDLTGKSCFGGLDLAAVSDANALSLVFPMGDYSILVNYYWLPEKTISKKTSGNYERWVRENHIKTCPGAIFDHEILINDVIALSKIYKIQSIGFDPHMAYSGVVQGITRANIKMFEFPQGIMEMTHPTKEFQKMVLSEKLKHFGDPVTRWMLSNVVIYRNANDAIKVHKGNSAGKVDGIVSAIMALGTMYRNKLSNSYTERGILSL